MVGPEQEYFLVDKNLAALRPDIMLAGRTLLGAPSPKGQEMEDHYFGAIPGRVMSFMQDVENELLALGIPAKTRHNEVAPGQFEIAPVYEEANIACDHNMLIMNMMRHMAGRHGFVCLLHEKPFAGVNGSGKHNNWSMCDSDGQNLLNPGTTPQDNAQFLVFLAAVLRAVHKHGTALRLGTVGAGNDHRLGANEAPPAILRSIWASSSPRCWTASSTAATPGTKKSPLMEVGVSTLPPLPVDLSDRNRTSPFAFYRQQVRVPGRGLLAVRGSGEHRAQCRRGLRPGRHRHRTGSRAFRGHGAERGPAGAAAPAVQGAYARGLQRQRLFRGLVRGSGRTQAAQPQQYRDRAGTLQRPGGDERPFCGTAS